MSFVFKDFLALFPRFFYFLASLRISTSRAISNLAAFPHPRPRPGCVWRRKARILCL